MAPGNVQNSPAVPESRVAQNADGKFVHSSERKYSESSFNVSRMSMGDQGQYDPNQKSLDEKLMDGTLAGRRRGGISGNVEKVYPPSAADTRAAFDARVAASSGDNKKDEKSRLMLRAAIEK